MKNYTAHNFSEFWERRLDSIASIRLEANVGTWCVSMAYTDDFAGTEQKIKFHLSREEFEDLLREGKRLLEVVE